MGKMRIDHTSDFIQSYYGCHRCQDKPWDYFKDLWVPAEGAYYTKCCKVRIKTRVPEPPHASYEPMPEPKPEHAGFYTQRPSLRCRPPPWVAP